MMNKIRDRLWEKASKNGIPLTVAFELLPLCNLSCKMCYVRKSAAEVKEAGGLIGGDQWIEIAREAADCGMLFPLITGGEPFLHPDFRKIFVEMLEMGMQVSINSNGTMIDREMAEWLSEHRPIRINITLYGASAETYERLCGRRDAFEKVKNAVHWLKAYSIPIKFNTSITPENVCDLDAIIAFAKSVDAPIQVAEYMYPPVRRDAQMVGHNERLTPDEAGRVRAYADLLLHDENWYRGMAKHSCGFLPPDEAIGQLPPSPNGGLSVECRAGRCSAWIDWQGNLMGCGVYAAEKMPLVKGKFAETWQKIHDQTEALRYSPSCERCLNRPFCHTCIAIVMNECGDSNGRPQYICEMMEAKAKYYQMYAQQLPSADGESADEVRPDLSGCDVNDL